MSSCLASVSDEGLFNDFAMQNYNKKTTYARESSYFAFFSINKRLISHFWRCFKRLILHFVTF